MQFQIIYLFSLSGPRLCSGASGRRSATGHWLTGRPATVAAELHTHGLPQSSLQPRWYLYGTLIALNSALRNPKALYSPGGLATDGGPTPRF